MSEISSRRVAHEALDYENPEEYMQDLVAGIQEFMKSKDEDAAETARAGFQELIKLTNEDTYAIAFRMCGNKDDALDIVQETYLRAYRGLPKFRRDSQFSTWLYRIVANNASTYLGKRSKHRHEQLDDMPENVVALDAELHEKAVNVHLRERLAEALHNLPATLRSTVVLRHIYDLPHVSPPDNPDADSIAKVLGISESASKVRLHRAHEKLKADLIADQEQTA